MPKTKDNSVLLVKRVDPSRLLVYVVSYSIASCLCVCLLPVWPHVFEAKYLCSTSAHEPEATRVQVGEFFPDGILWGERFRPWNKYILLYIIKGRSSPRLLAYVASQSCHVRTLEGEGGDFRLHVPVCGTAEQL